MHIPTSGFGSDPSWAYTQDDTGGGGGSPLRQWSSIIGIVTAIVGNLLISFALNTQRYAHIRIDREHKEWRRNSTRANLSPGYGTRQQEEIAEERSRINLGRKASNRTPSDGPHEPSLQPGFEPRQSRSDDRKGEDDDRGRQSYLTSPYWWTGLILMIIGEAGNFLAYGFAPASIVSPLGVVALISNCMIAPLMLKEHFRKRDFGAFSLPLLVLSRLFFRRALANRKSGLGSYGNPSSDGSFSSMFCSPACLLSVCCGPVLDMVEKPFLSILAWSVSLAVTPRYRQRAWHRCCRRPFTKHSLIPSSTFSSSSWSSRH